MMLNEYIPIMRIRSKLSIHFLFIVVSDIYEVYNFISTVISIKHC